jgi:hypothetical protein
MDPSIGTNINGPSLIRVPEGSTGALGRYYLYFAHHKGRFIRLAYADNLRGPWSIYRPGTLRMSQTVYRKHIASPDVHVLPESEPEPRFLMFYHGSNGAGPQTSRVAVSDNGLEFHPVGGDIGRPYFRVFRHNGWWHAVLNQGWLYRARSPLGRWEPRRQLNLPDGTRHVAIQVRGDTLRIFFSVRGDCPEHIRCAEVNMELPWEHWTADPPVTVLKPERAWEGSDLPLEASVTGLVDHPVHQLRDPGIYVEEGQTYLLYSVAGESGIAISEIQEG